MELLLMYTMAFVCDCSPAANGNHTNTSPLLQLRALPPSPSPSLRTRLQTEGREAQGEDYQATVMVCRSFSFKQRVVSIVSEPQLTKAIYHLHRDTAGQERFRSVTSSYYRGAHVS